MPSGVKKPRKTSKASRHFRNSRTRNSADLTRYSDRLLYRLGASRSCRPSFLVPSIRSDAFGVATAFKKEPEKREDKQPQYERFDLFDKDILKRGDLRLVNPIDAIRSVYRPSRPTDDQLAAAAAELDMEALPSTKPSLRRLRIPLEKPAISVELLAKNLVRHVKQFGDDLVHLLDCPYPNMAKRPCDNEPPTKKSAPVHGTAATLLTEMTPCTSAGRSTGIFLPFAAPGLGVPALPTSRLMDSDSRAALAFTTDTSTVQKIVSEILPPSSGVAFGKDARDLLIECCVEFITLISSEANEISEKEAKKTIACEHITKALEQLGFGEYVADILEVASEHKEQLKGREKKTKPFEGSGLSTDELLAMQEAAFREAAERHG